MGPLESKKSRDHAYNSTSSNHNKCSIGTVFTTSNCNSKEPQDFYSLEAYVEHAEHK